MTEPRSAQVIRTSCRGCHGVCQVLVHMEGDRVVKVTGDPDSPTSKGYLCPKGRAAPELLYHPDRLLYPLRRAGKRGENSWQRISWDEALDEMTERLSQIREELGPEFFAMAQGTGRPYTEFTLRFANAFGTPNFVGPGHLCYLPRVIASEITLGQLPISDIYGFGGEMPRCIMIWGCNITYSGAADGMCGGMLERALKKAEKVIVIDPRRIGPAERADQWLQIRPGTDAALALAMIQTIISEELFDREFVNAYTSGFDRLRDHVKHFSPEWAASITGLDAEGIRKAARTYALTRPSCIQWGNGLDMNASSFQCARAVLILMAITGNIDKPGGQALWVYPDGVKVKSVLVSHEQAGVQFLSAQQKERGIGAGVFPFAPATHPPTFWQSVITGDPYRVKAIWLVGTNPLMTGTQQLKIQRALADHLEYTVVSDLFMTPTAQYADLVLPAATWLEQEDVVSMHKIWCILARKQVARVGETRDDRDVMFDLAHRLGLHDAFPWKDRRAFNEWVLEDAGLDFDTLCDRGILLGKMRYRKYEADGFRTPSGKFEIFSSIAEHAGVEPLPVFRGAKRNAGPGENQVADFPLILLGGNKNRYFFH
ncbi:MAG: molybdopterin-dependent oxidoreductase [Deltaproteobacteria bacterium]